MIRRMAHRTQQPCMLTFQLRAMLRLYGSKKSYKNRKDPRDMPSDYSWVLRVLALMGPVNCLCASCDRVLTIDTTK